MTATLMEKTERFDQSKPLARKLLRGYLHKTSNSLCGIKGYAGLIIATEKSEDGASRWARKILAEIERMEDIFNSVGDLSMSSEPFFSGSDLPGVLNRCMESARTMNSGLQILCAPLPAGQLLLPEADLQLVLNEILQNSADASTNAHVKITGQVEITGRVVLCITDNGPGMSPELLKNASDPFVTTRDDHHGVGLTRVETILDMHGLAWSLTSSVGTGTAVTLEVAEALIIEPENCLTRKKGNK